MTPAVRKVTVVKKWGKKESTNKLLPSFDSAKVIIPSVYKSKVRFVLRS